jgi:hypothetical protein
MRFAASTGSPRRLGGGPGHHRPADLVDQGMPRSRHTPPDRGNGCGRGPHHGITPTRAAPRLGAAAPGAEERPVTASRCPCVTRP